MLRRPLSPLSRRVSALLTTAVAVAVAATVANAGPAAALQAEPAAASATSTGSSSSTGTASAAPGDTRTVRYKGVAVQVPRGWPVVDLDTDPTACVRLDQEAVYLGTPPAQQDCPAHAVGRAGTIWLAPAGTRDRSLAATGRADMFGGLSARVLDQGVGHEREVVLTGAGVVVRTAWGADPTPTQEAVDSIAPTVGPPADPATPTGTATPSSAAGPAARSSASGSATVGTAAYRSVSGAQPVTVAATASAGKHLTGMAFDACSAPSTSTMSAWRSSPYAAVGIYIGGSMRACGDGNLSASWVTTVTGYGWGLIPIYVGPQAPCVFQGGLAHISASNAAAQGTSNAADAIVSAQRFGLGAGTVIYYDMEAYATGNTSCTNAVLTFVTAWTAELRRQGYQSAVYGNPGSLMTDMSKAVAAHNAAFTPPDQVWYAHWNQLQDTKDAASYPAFKDNYWGGKRLHQYAGGHNEKWGGATINIDSNWVDAPLPGNPTQTDYGANTLGPGSAGFVFTGSMSDWTARPGVGMKGRAYSTHATASASESQGATWSPSLGPALYAVSAYVPTSGTTGTAHYRVTDARGTADPTVNQSTSKAYQPLGTYLALSGKPITVHLGDNGSSSTSQTINADAMQFSVVGTTPGAPTGVTAAPSDARANVSWAAAPANGATISGYTVTASPGGATATVSGSTRSVTMTGLADGTAYTFTVRATNIVGTGPASAASAAVVPTAAGRFVAITPVRVLDTRSGAPANPGIRSSVGANRTVTFAVAGSGAPVPSGATAVVLNLTVTAGTRPGHVDPASGGASLLNYATGQTVANLATLRLSPAGTVALRNVSGGAVHLIADVEGYVTPTATGGYWVATPPTRLVDTRRGTPLSSRATALGRGETVTVQVAHLVGSPVTADAVGAALRLTATASTRSGYLTVSDGGTTRSSTVNFGRRQTVGNVALVPLSASGAVTITNHSTGSVQLVVDLQGELSTAGTLWTPLTPARLLDTRRGTSANPGAAILAAGASRTVRIAGVTGSPVPAGAGAVAVNLTVVPTTASGWVSATDTGSTRTSAVNFPAGTVVANLALVPLAPDGTMVVHNGSTRPVHLVVDVQGYAAAAS